MRTGSSIWVRKEASTADESWPREHRSRSRGKRSRIRGRRWQPILPGATVRLHYSRINRTSAHPSSPHYENEIVDQGEQEQENCKDQNRDTQLAVEDRQLTLRGTGAGDGYQSSHHDAERPDDPSHRLPPATFKTD